MPLRPSKFMSVRLGLLAALALGAAAPAVAVGPHHAAPAIPPKPGEVVLGLGGPEQSVKHQRAGEADSEADQAFPDAAAAAHHALAPAPTTNTAAMGTGVSPGAPSDAEVRRELRQLERSGAAGAAGGGAQLQRNGLAQAPLTAPDPIARVIAGGNAIAKFPYVWGGGHGSFFARGYDCSGSVSYALAAGGLLDSPLTSGALAHWGKPGPGRWITIYANAGHVDMYVGGLRFDPSGRSGPLGPRWQAGARSNAGFAPRPPPGL